MPTIGSRHRAHGSASTGRTRRRGRRHHLAPLDGRHEPDRDPTVGVAGLALITTDGTGGTDGEKLSHIGPAAAVLRSRPDGELIAALRGLWVSYLNQRPDLIARAYLLCSWLFEAGMDPSIRDAAEATARAALDAGQLQLTGTDLRHEVDLLGVVLTHLRSNSARTGHGQFYTPADVATAMTALLGIDECRTADGTVDSTAVHEPAAGTGGLLRAAAQAMRRAGRHPATVVWSAVDIDELAIACLAVNAHLWNLGPNVLLGVGDALADDWRTRAEGDAQNACNSPSRSGGSRRCDNYSTLPRPAARPSASTSLPTHAARPARRHPLTVGTSRRCASLPSRPPLFNRGVSVWSAVSGRGGRLRLASKSSLSAWSARTW